MSEELAEQLFQRGALMSLYIGRWGAMKKMGANDLLLGEIDNDALYLGHKKLLPKKATEKLVEIEGKSRSLFASKSIDFPIAGARFVTFSAVPEIVDGLKELRDQWNGYVTELINEYPALMAKQLEILEQQATSIANEKLQLAEQETNPERRKYRQDQMNMWLAAQKIVNKSFYPPADELPRKFNFVWRMFRISNLDGTSELDPEDVKNAQERLRSDLRDWVATATTQIHQTLGEAAQNARNILEKKGKLTPRNIKPLFDAFESFLSVDFTGKSSFRETIETLKKGFLFNSPGGYSDAMAERVSSSTEFAGLLNSLSSLAVEDIAKKAGVTSAIGSFGRLLDI